MKEFADKLIDITELHKDSIAKEWCKAVRANPRTPSFHKLLSEECFTRALSFYTNLRKIYYSAKPYTEVRQFFASYAEENFREGIPLHETIYSMIMMRRHMWLYADFQAPFLTAIDHQQAVETINKTIRIFDHGIYLVIQKYNELSKKQ